MKVIGIIGSIGSGKDTSADWMIQNKGFQRLAFATKVKDVAHVVFGWDREKLEGLTKESRAWREEVCPFWNITPRKALQLIGTEMFRKMIDDQVWVKTVVKQIQESNKNTVITDCRFENEFQAIKDLGGKILYIQRGPEPEWASKAASGAEFDEKYGVHVTDWNIYVLKGKADIVIENNGTLKDLYDTLAEIV